MKPYVIILLALLGITTIGHASSEQTPKRKKSKTDQRIKKQEKHRKKHPCPQIDC
jgi:hypothetical protein